MPLLMLSEILGLFRRYRLSMTSILFAIVRISNNQFKCNYLRNKKLFSEFSSPYLKYTSTF